MLFTGRNEGYVTILASTQLFNNGRRETIVASFVINNELAHPGQCKRVPINKTFKLESSVKGLESGWRKKFLRDPSIWRFLFNYIPDNLQQIN